jgi:hypothetical protein
MTHILAKMLKKAISPCPLGSACVGFSSIFTNLFSYPLYNEGTTEKILLS